MEATLSASDFLDQFEQQRTDEGLQQEANKRPSIPCGKYIMTLEYKGGEIEPEGTEWGCPGRSIFLFSAKLVDAEDPEKSYREPFFRVSPEDWRKDRHTGEWLRKGDEGFSVLRQGKEARYWGNLIAFDKKGEMSIKEQVMAVQERMYSVTVKHLYKNTQDEFKTWGKNDTVEEGYSLVKHQLMNIYELKDVVI